MFDELFKILVYSKTNIGNCREFITEYVKNPNFFVAFLGSGINTPLQNVPNWKDLFFKLREKYCPNLQLITENEITPEDFSNIYKEVEDRENFDEYVINSVKPKGTYCTGTSWQLSRAFNNFITTNYYEPVEKAFKDCYSKEKRALKRFNMLTDLKIISENRLKDTILYLHGNIDTGFIILRKCDYDYFYPSNNGHKGIFILERLIRFYLNNYKIVFIGASFEKEIKELIVNARTNLMKNNKQDIDEHYMLKGTDSYIKRFRQIHKDSQFIADLEILGTNKFSVFVEEEIEEYYRKYKIKLIIYTGDHTFINDICQKLYDIKPDENQPIVGSYQPED